MTKKIEILIVVVGIAFLATLPFLHLNSAPEKSYDRSWASEKSDIKLSDAKFHIHVRMSPNLSAKSRQTLFNFETLRSGLEERIAVQTKALLHLTEVGRKENSIIYSVEFLSSGPIEIPSLARPRCCLHYEDISLIQNPDNIKISPDFASHRCEQATNLASLNGASRYTVHPSRPDRKRKETDESYAQRLIEEDGLSSPEKISTWLSSDLEKQLSQVLGSFSSGGPAGRAPIGNVPALIHFGGESLGESRGSMSEHIERVEVIECTVPNSKLIMDATTPTTIQIVGLKIYPRSIEDRLFTTWTKDNIGKSLVVLVDGWVLTKMTLASALPVGGPIMLRGGGDAPRSFLIVSLLHSIGVIDIEVLSK